MNAHSLPRICDCWLCSSILLNLLLCGAIVTVFTFFTKLYKDFIFIFPNLLTLSLTLIQSKDVPSFWLPPMNTMAQYGHFPRTHPGFVPVPFFHPIPPKSFQSRYLINIFWNNSPQLQSNSCQSHNCIPNHRHLRPMDSTMLRQLSSNQHRRKIYENIGIFDKRNGIH